MTAAETLDHCVVADAVNVGKVRQEFSRWLRQFGLSPDRHNDLVLAVNEALANVAEFAYEHSPAPGVVRFSARHDAASASLTVTVADEGRWREPTASDIPDLRGRGIPLMRSLSDDTEIETSPTGTTVRLRFDGIGDSVGDMAGAIQV
jgi:serine/threonine-protein kinase RsbW